MDLLFWHHDATGFLALTVVAWALTVISAMVAARLEEAEARAQLAHEPARLLRAQLALEPAAELGQPATVALRIA